MKILCVGGELDGKYFDTGSLGILPVIYASKTVPGECGLSGTLIKQSYKLVELLDEDRTVVRFYLHGGEVASPIKQLLIYYEATVRDLRSALTT